MLSEHIWNLIIMLRAAPPDETTAHDSDGCADVANKVQMPRFPLVSADLLSVAWRYVSGVVQSCIGSSCSYVL